MAVTAKNAGGESPEDEFRQLLHNLRASAEVQSLRGLAEEASIPVSSLHGIFSGSHLPTRDTLDRLLVVLRASSLQTVPIWRAWSEAARAREARRASRARPTGQDGHAGTRTPDPLVIHNDGGTVYVNAADSGGDSPVRKPPALIPDMDGHALKPNPLEAATFDELIELMREFRAWAGRPSTRDLAHQSGGEFSHATISKVLSSRPGGKPPLKLGYVRGFICACGGDEEEQKRWITAWRRIDQGKAAPRGPHTSNVFAMKPNTGTPAEPASLASDGSRTWVRIRRRSP